MKPTRKIKPSKSRRQGASASNISLQANQAFLQPQAPAAHEDSGSFQFQVPQTPAPNPRPEGNVAFGSPQPSHPFAQVQQAPTNTQYSTWRTQSQNHISPEEEVPDDNPFTQDSFAPPSEEPNPFASLTHNYHPPGQFFARKMKYNVDPSEVVEDDNHLVSPDYIPEPEPQEPNPFASISWKNSASQRAFQAADEAFQGGNQITTTIATVTPPPNGLLEAESVMPAHFVDPAVAPPSGMAVAGAAVHMPGTPKVTVGLSLTELQGAASVEASFNVETGILELKVRSVSGDI
ncbi:hypothetical protein EG327_010782 [Venturia inaequalis]|uniref:Uncharacterized protein n=1 Tax=Venturia inaequalis TaxID=5025 RepID=A0A8H3UG67_VENIN|nr:hypothetical protein EG327_010782 [Venturia inaequalis]